MSRKRSSPSPAQGSPGPFHPPSPQKARVILGSEHGNDLAPLTYSVCKHCVHMIRKEMADQLVVDNKTPVIPTGQGQAAQPSQ